jgi:hypothetical protein
MPTFELDWAEADLGGSAVVSYGSGAILDFVDKPAGATSALSITSGQADGVDNILLELEVETSGSSVMTFDYKVSTESGWDKFHIDVDGVSQANYSGLVAWTTHAGISIPSAGVHTIRFRYTKDSGGASNEDRVWVALLNITNTVTVNDAAGTVDTLDLEDGAIPAAVATSTWTNSTSAPISGTRSLRSPAAPANSGTYDLTITKPAGTDYATVGFDWKVSSEAGWDELILFPNASAPNVPATGKPSATGGAGWLDWSGTASGHIAVILPAAESTLLLRYTKDGGGAAGADAAWIDNISLPAASGGGVELFRSTSETASPSDTTTRVRTGPRAVAEAATASDATARAVARGRTTTDAATASDATSRQVSRTRALTDAATASDTSSRLVTRPRSVAEALTLADTAVRASSSRDRALLETLTLTDVATSGASTSRQTTETLTLTDVAALAVGLPLLDIRFLATSSRQRAVTVTPDPDRADRVTITGRRLEMTTAGRPAPQP